MLGCMGGHQTSAVNFSLITISDVPLTPAAPVELLSGQQVRLCRVVGQLPGVNVCNCVGVFFSALGKTSLNKERKYLDFLMIKKKKKKKLNVQACV